MPYREEYLESAILDLIEIQAWYEAQRIGLGSEFQNALTARLDLLLEFPDSAPVFSQKNARKVSLDQFPYYVIYTIRQETIWVVAIVHHKRHPKYWVSRLKLLD